MNKNTRRTAYTGAALLPVALIAIMFTVGFNGGTDSNSIPNLSLNNAAVTCATAHDVQNLFTPAVHDATKASPDYTGVEKFGFSAPMYPSDIAPFQGVLHARTAQIDRKVKDVDAGNCTDNPTASVTMADGQTVTLPVIIGSQPDQPISGAQSNKDSRTVPVTIGAPSNDTRTNTWSDLDQAFGSQKWYTDCANSNLDMNWATDVPKYESTEDVHDNRFILAVNVSSSLTDDQIRQQASNDGNPNVDSLPIVRTPSIVNTRHLDSNRCDPFIDARSQVRVSLGKVVFDDQGQFKDLEQDKGAFVDCHNQWWIPKSPPVPTPGQPTPPGIPSTTSATTAPPPHTTTTQPPGCTNNGIPPKCLEQKDGGAGAGTRGNVPTSVQGQAPLPDPTAEPRPTNPPTSYKAPAPPPPPPPTSHSAPPVETTAAGPPATGCVPPPGMTTC